MNSNPTTARRRKDSVAIIATVIVVSCVVAGLVAFRMVSSSAQTAVGNQYAKNGIHEFNDMFGNFSQMTVAVNSTQQDGSQSSFVASYAVLGTTSVEGVRVYEVNVTGTDSGNGASDTESLLAWVSTSNGQMVKTYDDEDGYLYGARAEEENSTLFTFTTMSWLSMINSSTVSKAAGSEQAMTLGKVNMEVLRFEGLQSFTMLQNWKIDVGTIPSSGIQFVTYSSFNFSGCQSTFEILSMTPAS